MSPATAPELSIIIPTLNEEIALPRLLEDLLVQQEVTFEVLVSDGGSRDATCQCVSQMLGPTPLSWRLLTGSAGRGRQMNRAVRDAGGEWLLFLHADSRIHDRRALRSGIDHLKGRMASDGDDRVAGRFALRFDTGEAGRNPDLYLCEARARLDEPATIHGDQGFLLHRHFFMDIGPYREDLPVMEDTWFAEKVRCAGHWERMPAEIVTSPRRFNTEGLRERQTLNALLVNFLFVGWDEFLHAAPGIYRQQADVGRLRLQPFWEEIRFRLRQQSLRGRCRLWYATGQFVRSQAWQLVFRRKVSRCFKHHLDVDQIDQGCIQRFKRWFDPLTDHWFGAVLFGGGTWCWFHLLGLRLRCQR